MSRGDLYQISLIGLGVAATALLGSFLYREIFPEYKIYQNDYIALEKFRSSYTGEAPPEFKTGVKQIVLLREDKGPPVIDRCTSCHVALQFEHFSPTKVVVGKDGAPQQVPNDDYVWARLDAKILELRQASKNSEANDLESLKTASVGGHIYDVTKVLRMHPLMGAETRPFEFHPIDEYGCVSCHNGNGRGLTTEKAHGPVFDGQYEIEDMGYTPTFLESDPKNDPPFSKVFNHKPGHELLFQTTPIYVGALLQAKCVQCHQSSVGVLMNSIDVVNSPDVPPTPSPQKNAVELLTQNFHRGESLFLSQACYACHRISGLSRGGVGPELTREGTSYPWFVKESIVWPQADLKTSTMPNYRMDHYEIEDLLTFLLAQTGGNNAVSSVAYKSAIAAWDNGQKLPWEKGIPPTQIVNLDDSMTIFATEGCAACHRLRGYTSDVGFAVEKNKNVDFATLYQEKEWFRRLIPETITGSELAAILEKHADDFDKRVIHHVHEHALLNEIEKKSPETIEAYYSNFRFAARTKNDAAWKDRIHRALMVYIQEYGLGRLIGPRPNWSGVYRTDEWLMEHFKNPSGHVPRSIMPVFPFDETKFYALTYMLDVLGIRNRNADRAVWTERGFNPEAAYQLYCSQCHGTNLHGDGPVAEWIYPIPKNLRNSDFLHQLTRERAVQSITHGVHGTPMAPWGEAARDKGTSDGTPVLSQEEINALVDWLYAGLPGREVLRSSEGIPKWKYSPQDVLNDLENEGNSKRFLENGNEIFDVKPAVIQGTEKNDYFIKKKFYTEANLLAGQAFFELNCAACHGRDADGSGLRASAMEEAKPRILVNFDWINSRDDLRLIRSIKFGVAGTSMTPWGDQTNSLQRLQLVMYIRSLTDEKKERRMIDDAIYSVFDATDQQLEELRAAEYVELDKTQQQLSSLQQRKRDLYSKVTEGEAPSKDLLDLVQQEINLVGKMNALTAKDKQLLDLKGLLKQERDLYLGMGVSLLQLKPGEELLNDYATFITKLKPRLAIEKGNTLVVKEGASATGESITSWLQSSIKAVESRIIITNGMVASEEKTEQLSLMEHQLHSLKMLEKKWVSTEEQGAKLRAAQRDLINTYNAKNKS
jgi:mono/diheme cytochrome c family protein